MMIFIVLNVDLASGTRDLCLNNAAWKSSLHVTHGKSCRDEDCSNNIRDGRVDDAVCCE